MSILQVMCKGVCVFCTFPLSTLLPMLLPRALLACLSGRELGLGNDCSTDNGPVFQCSTGSAQHWLPARISVSHPGMVQIKMFSFSMVNLKVLCAFRIYLEFSWWQHQSYQISLPQGSALLPSSYDLLIEKKRTFGQMAFDDLCHIAALMVSPVDHFYSAAS